MTRLRLRDPDELDPTRARYVKMMIHAATTGRPLRPSPMDAGLVLCDVLAGREVRWGEQPPTDAGTRLPGLYRMLLRYAAGLAARLPGEATTTPRIPDDAGPAGDAVNAWRELAAYVVSPSAPVPTLQRLAEAPRGPGPLLPGLSGTIHPEVDWMHEITLLHALTSFALLRGDADARAAVAAAARFHHAETQPDHATSQPWAIHAFLLDLDTLPTADLMLLAANINQPKGLDAVSRILLADAAVCLLASV